MFKWLKRGGTLRSNRFRVNKYDALMFIVVLLFVFSENTMNIEWLDNLFAILERVKLKFLFSFLCCAYFYVKMPKRNLLFGDEFRLYLRNIVILVGISIGSILIFGNRADLINESLYFFVPLFLSFFLINVRKGSVDKCISYVFWAILIAFIIEFRDKLTLTNILSINFLNSYSPFEGELAFLSMLLVVYYSWKGERFKKIGSLVICFLSFKRITMIFSIFAFVFMKALRNKTVNSLKRYQWIIIAIFIAVPVAMNIICSDSFATFFHSMTGIDFNLFVKGRFLAMSVAFNDYQIAGGLGSVRVFLSEYFRNYFNTNIRTYDLHCDIVRIYLECTILGLFSHVFAYVKSAKSPATLFLIFYILLECCVNHMFGGGRSLYWIVAYLIIYSFNNPEFIENNEKILNS